MQHDPQGSGTSRAFIPTEDTKINDRSFFASPISQAPEISQAAHANTFRRLASLDGPVSNAMKQAIQNGSPIKDLIRASPEEVIQVLKDYAVVKLGSFNVKDVDVLRAFNGRTMLTVGSETARDEDWEAKWNAIISSKLSQHPHRGLLLDELQWEENVKVVAFVVNIKNAAAGRDDGLLSPLVEKSQSGATSDDIWDFLAVRAVIEYKWTHWAKKYMLFEFGLYIGWVISYVVFLTIYIEAKIDGDISNEDDKRHSVARGFLEFAANLADALTCLFMLPFISIEFNTINFYGVRWFQLWNILDMIAYILQFIIIYGHMSGSIIETKGFHTILAVQCVLLVIKVQYFARAFFEGASFVELLTTVMYKVRWFLVFIVLTMFSVALAFAVLYKNDAERADKDTDEDFGNVARALVTTYAILLGDFDSAYVFDTSNRVVKGLFFLVFQVIMSITVLNLLIAVMTESYSNVMKNRRILFNIGRAQVMDELEIALPRQWGPDLKPFCHFLVVDRTKREEPDHLFSAEISSELRPDVGNDEMQKDIHELKESMAELKNLVQEMVNKMS